MAHLENCAVVVSTLQVGVGEREKEHTHVALHWQAPPCQIYDGAIAPLFEGFISREEGSFSLQQPRNCFAEITIVAFFWLLMLTFTVMD